ncbi:MAG TPA: hypothetical protein VNX01_16845 [Bacteroidia bacterium]|nr:hypothetical protein [Bacteroidia bacterium]
MQKMQGKWVFKQSRPIQKQNCVFYGEDINGLCEKMELIIKSKTNTYNGVNNTNYSYNVFHNMFGVKDNTILNEKEIDDSNLNNSSVVELLPLTDPSEKPKNLNTVDNQRIAVFNCISTKGIKGFYQNTLFWDDAKGAFYSYYNYNICGVDYLFEGYWERVE